MHYFLIFFLFTFITAQNSIIITSQSAAAASSNNSTTLNSTTKDDILQKLGTINQKLEEQRKRSTTLLLHKNTSSQESSSSLFTTSNSNSNATVITPDTNTNNYLTDKIIPATAIITSVSAACYLMPSSHTPTRSLLSAGDAFGAAGATKALGFVAAIIAGSYWTSRLLSGLHYGCQRDKDLLEQKLENKITEMENRWSTSLQTSLQAHMAAINTKDAALVDELNNALHAQREETNDLVAPIIEALEHSVNAFGHNTPELIDKLKEETNAAITKAKQELADLQKPSTAPIMHQPSMPGITFNLPERPKEKTDCCCLIQ